MSKQDQQVVIGELMKTSGVPFGTSGARGLVTAMTDAICYAYTVAFLQHLRQSDQLSGQRVAIAGDMRGSTPRIMEAVASAVADFGLQPEFCGRIPSPTVACYGMAQAIPSIMVTGSHIPDDRNGIKFNTAAGEILKNDEAGIRAQQVKIPGTRFGADGMFVANHKPCLPPLNRAAHDHYVKRYADFFPKDMLKGVAIGLYQHSSVCREIFADVMTALGANVTKLGFSEKFVSVDTEAIRPEDSALAKQWASSHRFATIISADGDADRPMLSDENGNWLRGDVAGILCARYLGAQVVVTPVSSNTAVEKSNYFRQVIRTRIGSPYVVAAMQEAMRSATGPVVGYEANGGFLTGTDVTLSGRTLTALPTRDSVLVPLAILALAQQQKQSIGQLLATLPARYTASNRVENFPTELSRTKLAEFYANDPSRDYPAIEKVFGKDFGKVTHIDATDGVRVTFASAEVVHLRPSGNAPELRCYNEAASEARALEMNKICMAILERWKHG